MRKRVKHLSHSSFKVMQTNKMYSVLTHDDTAVDHRAAIVNKIFKAALKELSPGQKPCIDPGQFDFAILLTELRFSNHFKLPEDSYCDLFKAFNRIVELKILELKDILYNIIIHFLL